MKLPEADDLAALWQNTKIGFIVLLVAFPPYVIVNHLFYDRPAVNLAIAADHWLPFNHTWILVYAMVYVFLFLPVFIVRDKFSFYYVAKGYLMVNFISVARVFMTTIAACGLSNGNAGASPGILRASGSTAGSTLCAYQPILTGPRRLRRQIIHSATTILISHPSAIIASRLCPVGVATTSI